MRAARQDFVFWLAAAPYVALSWSFPYPLSWFLKLLPLAILVGFALRFARDTGRSMPPLWWVGLALSAVGDVFMDLDRQGYVTYGIAAFSVAYIFYSVEFWKSAHLRFSPTLRAGVAAVYVAGFAAVIVPGAGELQIAVLIYSLVLANLGVSASLGLPGWLGFAAVGSLLVSDTLIGLDLFGGGLGVPRAVIIVTYYFGQWGIARSLQARGPLLRAT